MLEIDLYRVRIGTFVPSFSPNSRKKSKNLYNSNSARLVLILIVLNSFMFSFVYENETNVINKSESPWELSSVGVYTPVRICIVLVCFHENMEFVVKGRNQTSNFVARMTYGNKRRGIINMQLNIRSLYNKMNEIKMLIKSEKPHILGITEAELWRSHHSLDTLRVPGYDLLVPKSWEVLGKARVVVYIKNTLQYDKIDNLEHEDTQTVWFRAGFRNMKKVYFSVQYREHTNTLGNSLGAQKRNLELMLNQWGSAVSYGGDYNEVHISGDFNLDSLNGRWLQAGYSLLSLAKMVSESCKAHSLCQIVDKVTRSQYDSVKNVFHRSCIDHVYCNYRHRVSSIKIISCGASDHDGVLYTRYSKEPKSPAKTKRKRSYKGFDEEKYKSDVSKINFGAVYSQKDVDMAARVLTDLLVNVLNDNAPWILFQERNHYAPWISNDTANLMKKRDELKEKAKNSCAQAQMDAWENYKKIRNKVTNRLKQEEIRFKREKMEECKGGPSQTWKVAKRIMNWSSSGPPAQLEHTVAGNPILVTKALDIANLMNEFFINKVQNIVNSLKQVPEDLSGCYKIMRGRNISLSAEYIPVKKVRKLLANLKTKTSTSIDQLDNYAVKLVSDIIAEPLHYVISLSLMQQKFPACWKLTKIIPLHKKDSTLEMRNYRPVAILSPLSKVLERAVYDQIYSYFDRNKLLHPSLHGYRKNRSTTTALLSMYDKWVKSAAEGNLTGVVLVDLSAAFDLVSPRLLSKKLCIYGLDSSFVEWISSYLRDRHQTVWIDHLYSSFIENSVGVPQGSILGPLFFLIYFNDLPTVIDNEIECYADDSTLSKSGDSIKQISDSLTSDCNSLDKWVKENYFKLNTQKTHFTVLGTSSKLKKNEETIKVSIDGTELTQSSQKSEMLLRIKIQTDLKWNEHIDFLASKLDKRLGALEKLRYIMDRKTRKRIVEGIFNSVLCYCLPVFGGCSQQDLKSLQVLQNRAARLVLRAPPRTSRLTMFQKLDWLTVSQLIAYHTLITVFRIRKSKEPEGLAQVLSLDSRQGRIIMPNSRHDIYRNSFIYRGSQLWNSLPSEVREYDKISSFKKRVRDWVKNNVNKFNE